MNIQNEKLPTSLSNSGMNNEVNEFSQQHNEMLVMSNILQMVWSISI